MNGVPWFKCFPADFLNGVADLAPNELAVYTICLMRMYDEGGDIPDDAERIAKRCNMRPTTCQKAIDALVALNMLARIGSNLSAPAIARWATMGGRETIPPSVRAEIYERDGGRCVYCGAETGQRFHIDHVFPLAHGGNNDPDNLALACPPCNLAKGAKSILEWKQ